MQRGNQITLDVLHIKGGNKLRGTVTIGGAKNAAVALLPATLLAESACTIENLPEIDDVLLYADILRNLGATVEQSGPHTMRIDPAKLCDCHADYELVQKMRASYYLLGAMLGRYGRAELALPGGCAIGARPIDLHVKGLSALGADIDIRHGILFAEAANGLRGTDIYLDFASVGATINIMLAACRAEGQTVISNAAKEPHVVDVANFLNCMGAHIRGAGTDNIRIEGKKELHGTSYAVIPDQIETGTYMIAAAATRSDVIIRNVIPLHLEAVSAKLMEMGVMVEEGDDGHEFFLRVSCERPRLRPVNIRTLPYPGFPTDLQQPMMSMLTSCKGGSVIVESIYEDRFKQVDALQKMGANINVNGRVAIVEGVERLSGAPVEASDLRAGAALVVAGLMADGVTSITGVHHIDRGYERLVEKLTALGADIERVQVEGGYNPYSLRHG